MHQHEEPSKAARVAAFLLLVGHGYCLRENVPMNDLIDAIAAAIDEARGSLAHAADDELQCS